MKRKGFTYISTLIAAMLIGIMALSIAYIYTLAVENKQDNLAQSVLTQAMINITEELKLEVLQGIDISDYVAAIRLSQYDDVSGNVMVKKEYVLSDTAIYIVDFNLQYKRSRLTDCVVIYGNE